VYTLHSLYSRSMLCESFKTVMESIQRRFATDAELLGNEKKQWFIDMRKHDEFKGVATIARQHKKKLSTYMMFNKEFKKFHDQTLCPWAGVRRVPDTMLFVLVETVRAKAAKEARQGKPAKVHSCRISTTGTTNMTFLQAAQDECRIVHIVDLTGFEWQDSLTNM
jgi:hypothetical protein